MPTLIEQRWGSYEQVSFLILIRGHLHDHRSFFVDQSTAGQEVALTPLEATEVARGYRAETLKLKPVVNDKNETVGRINDFIFGKDGNIYAVLAVGDFTGLGGHLIAIPFRSLKLDDPSSYIVLPGATRAALEKLPVYVNNR
jgi:PRC-barrel domain